MTSVRNGIVYGKSMGAESNSRRLCPTRTNHGLISERGFSGAVGAVLARGMFGDDLKRETVGLHVVAPQKLHGLVAHVRTSGDSCV